MTDQEAAAGRAGSGSGRRARPTVRTAAARDPFTCSPLTRRPLPGLSPRLITCIVAGG